MYVLWFKVPLTFKDEVAMAQHETISRSKDAQATWYALHLSWQNFGRSSEASSSSWQPNPKGCGKGRAETKGERTRIGRSSKREISSRSVSKTTSGSRTTTTRKAKANGR